MSLPGQKGEQVVGTFEMLSEKEGVERMTDLRGLQQLREVKLDATC